MSSALMPTAWAFSRSSVTRTSGLLNFRSLSTKVNTSCSRAAARNRGNASSSTGMSTACTTKRTPVSFARRSPMLASCVMFTRTPVKRFCSTRRESAICAWRALALALVLEEHAHEAGIHGALNARSRRPPGHLRHHEMRLGDQLGGRARQLIHVALHVLVADALETGRAHPDPAAIFHRRQLARQQR